MPPRRRSNRARAAWPAGVALVALVAGCTGDAAAVREPGTAVTRAEADALSRLLQRNFQRGGADFVVTAPYGDDVVLTLTGEVDFRRSQGSAQVMTSYGDDRPDDTATVWFSADALWVGDDPRVAAALAQSGITGATYLRRSLATGGDADLVDVLVRVVLDLSRSRADDPRGFLDGDWTWQGQRSIDSRLSAVFADADGASVAVDAADDLLRQYETPLPGQSFEVTVTLADHGPVSVTLPADAASVDVAGHPELAGAVGF
jgi:hypothetical protein